MALEPWAWVRRVRTLADMAQRYTLNYDWSHLGPTQWTDFSVVTLQFDLHSYDYGDAVWSAVSAWHAAMPTDADPELFPDGGDVAYAGGCRFPAPARVNEQHLTGWIVSQGQDAFDSIAHYANELREIAEKADPEVVATWTELPHR